MSNDKPINAMYGQKVKLNLDKIKNRKENSVETVEEAPKPVEEVVEKPVEEVSEPVGEVVEEAVEEVSEPVEEPPKEASEKKSSSKSDYVQLDNLKQKLKEKDEKLSNQSSELNYLTNKIIPNLKKENAELNKVKNELTDALEKTTRKYFDQLDINADLSNQIGKLGAEGAVNKVRADKLENEVKTIKDDLQAEIDEYKEKLAETNVDDIKNENAKLSAELDDLKEKLSDSRKENIGLSEEVDKLRAELIELGNYKDEVDTNMKQEMNQYKEEISSLKTQLKVKESSYDKLSNESKSKISKLNNTVSRLEEELEKQSNKGLFNRLR